jgi:molybdenum storage protein
VDGLYNADPRLEPAAAFIPEIGVNELRRRKLATLPFEPVLLDLLENARLLDRFQIINGLHPQRIAAALNGDRVGTIVHRN